MLNNFTFSYGCQTWSLTRQERGSRATEERILGQGVYFDLTKEITERDNMHNEKFCNLHSSPNITRITNESRITR